MRILAAFFTILFTFINPAMLMRVVSEVENLFENRSWHPPLAFFDDLVAFFINNNWAGKLKTFVYLSVLVFMLLHVVLTCFCLYGIYSSRPAFMRPILYDIAFSFTILFLFVMLSLFMYWRYNTFGTRSAQDTMKLHLRNLYVGGAFLLTYIVWLSVTYAGYSDTRKMHADFMYWIVEERMSTRQHGHNVGRSNRSSNGSRLSRASKASSRSVRSERWASTRPNSVNTGVASKRSSLANVRLSVPL